MKWLILMCNITELLNITKKAVTIAEESEKFVLAALQTDIGIKSLISRNTALYDGLIPSDNISFNEVVQNNYEFLDTLNAIIGRIIQHIDKQSLREKVKLETLNGEINLLMAELNSHLFLQKRKSNFKPTNVFLQHEKPDTDLKEPSHLTTVTMNPKTDAKLPEPRIGF
jgi:Ni,Fe-hydrogenase I large subunit